jgi:hypothetical protein
MVLLNAGPGAKVPQCEQNPVETIAMAGNEKSSVLFSVANSTVKSGYRLAWADTFTLNTQLMNMEDKEKWVWVAITYDYLDNPPKDVYASHMIWEFLTNEPANLCAGAIKTVNPFGATNLTQDLQPLRPQFSEHTMPMEAALDGMMLAAAGHLHDGGVEIEMFQNDKRICSAVASYGKGEGHSHARRSRTLSPRQIPGGAASNEQIEHIKGMTRCNWQDGIKVSKRDKLFIRANYDFVKHPGCVEHTPRNCMKEALTVG